MAVESETYAELGICSCNTDAIYALILTGNDWLNENNTCTVTWGGKTYSTAEGETATGYLKVVLDEKEISSGSNSISIRKEGNTPAWEAVYEQYFENIDKVEKQKGVLNVEKKLFIENNSGSGLQIVPVENGKLRVGDKVIVRLTIRTDREMDYVFLKDLRAGLFRTSQPAIRNTVQRRSRLLPVAYGCFRKLLLQPPAGRNFRY